MYYESGTSCSRTEHTFSDAPAFEGMLAPGDMGNKLYCGDNLEILREYIPDSSVDLIYLDPPFNSQRTYNLIYKGSQAQEVAFKDYWSWAEAAATYVQAVDDARVPRRLRAVLKTLHETLMDEDSDLLAYLVMMSVRLVELHRKLKPTGSLYLHCDPTASHYLKVILDHMFGARGFQSELIWKRSGAHSGARRYGPVHDSLLFYTRSDAYTWNPIFQPLPGETADAWYNNIEPGTGRRFNRDNLTAAGVRSGSSGLPWRGVDPTPKGRHWAIPGFARAIIGDLDTIEALEALDKAGRIFWPKKAGGAPMFKRYLDESDGVPAQDVITDISPLKNNSPERMGYPTQKPGALLDRVILASSNPGDLVLDAFCGCGTSIESAERLGRQWIGIDIARKAVEIVEKRFRDKELPLPEVLWHPADYESAQALAERDSFQFEQWVLRRIGARRIEKHDRGIDGEAHFKNGGPYRVIVSVKGGRTLNPAMVRELRGTIEREAAPIGVLVSMQEPSKEMRLEAARAQFVQGAHDPQGPIPRIQLLTVGEIFAGGRIRAPGHNVTQRQSPVFAHSPQLTLFEDVKPSIKKATMGAQKKQTG